MWVKQKSSRAFGPIKERLAFAKPQLVVLQPDANMGDEEVYRDGINLSFAPQNKYMPHFFCTFAVP